MPAVRIRNVNASTAIAPPPQQWKSFHFNVPNFKDLSSTEGHFFDTPEFSCNGHQWNLRIYPGGAFGATEGFVSIYLSHQSEGSITVIYDLMILDKFGDKKRGKESKKRYNFVGKCGRLGRPNCIKRSDILDESNDLLDSDGTLTVGVSIKEEQSDVFVPKNPFQEMIQGMFLDEDTADVCFEIISNAEAKKGRKKKVKASDLFHSHYCILKKCAPMLANLFDLDDRDGKVATATITDVKPDIFRRLLYYVYGGSVPEDELKANAKDIIDVADKYSIVNLKLEAEAAYVKSTVVTMDNVMDNLLYADAKNCALLKETAMNFLAENSVAAEEISFDNVPGYLMKDLLVAVNRKGISKKDASGTTAEELTSLSVSALRRKLAEKGLDIDGSREAMIESIKNNS